MVSYNRPRPLLVMTSPSGLAAEAFTLLGIGLASTALRLGLGVWPRGRKKEGDVSASSLSVDDGLVVAASALYVVEATLAYLGESRARGLTNSFVPEGDVALGSVEVDARVLGSKLYFASWITSSALTWCLKAAVCVLFLRLANHHHRGYRLPAFIGLGFLAVTWLAATLVLLLGCRPLTHMWRRVDEPAAGLEPTTTSCRPASSPPLVWTYAGLGVATSLYLVALPAPMLAKAVLPAWQRVVTGVLMACGLVAAAAAVLRAVAVSSYHDVTLSRQWALREEFIALMTVNLAAILPTAIQHAVSPPSSNSCTHKQWELQKHISSSSWPRDAKAGHHGDGDNRSDGGESQTTCVGTVYVIDVSEKVETEVEVVTVAAAVDGAARVSGSGGGGGGGGGEEGRGEKEHEPQIQRRVEVCVVAAAPHAQGRHASESGNYTGVWSGPGEGVTQTRSRFFGDHIHQRAYVRM
ncbi:benzoate 4-monooxygenase cytochrome P450 [Purpureocillium lavendulum]|uniref:Benzoate 4-monooxygenase cytochrome P450 n=1 Tax=Purpureocillium lavendulum TaxID=1247861 RepID=A0AB34FQT6_9HYPO|nr:benzoate 4-monooxygenase cytochrome P450 [Purpureocillium lavendulum]